MREYIYSLMVDKRNGFLAAVIKPLLYTVSLFYGLSVKLLRRIKTRTAASVPCKVVSVGNLTMGGTGKTPTVCMMAKLFKAEGRAPAVLIRGYGDDEHNMLRRLLKGIPVIVGKDRVSTGMRACEKFGADILILDDGFQHWRLKRDLDIVLVDSTNPFGNGHLFPRGILRESASALKRADIIVLTKTDMVPKSIDSVMYRLKTLAGGTPVLKAVHKPSGLYDLDGGSEIAPSSIRGRKVCALSSIVNTGYFEFLLKTLGADIALRFHYPDHYDYKPKDIKRVFSECKKENINTIVTTEKDAVKIRVMHHTLYANNKTRILALRISMEIRYGQEIFKERLRVLYSD